jgi:hypothetical protein
MALSFTVNSPISPGDPLSFSWKLRVFSENFPGNFVAVSLSVNGTVVWIALFPVSVIEVIATPPAVGGWILDTGTQQESLTFAPDSPAAQALYGNASVSMVDPSFNKNLQLTVSGTAENAPGPFTATADLLMVINETDFLIKAKWAWTGTPPPALSWPASYTLTGTTSNPTSVPLTVSASLFNAPVGSIGSVGSLLETKSVGTVAPVATTGPIAFAPILQNWQWCEPPSFSPSPTSLTFAYVAEAAYQDPWGNQYPQTLSTPVTVTVTVPPAKVTQANDAVIAAVSAAALLVAAAASFPVGGIFAATAAIVYALALTFWVYANDPPLPDPKYKESVESKSVGDVIHTSGSSTLGPIASFFHLLQLIAADRDALSVVQGRIVGAIRASDQEALNLQIRKHVELTSHMQDLALQLPAATGSAIQAARSEPLFDSAKIRATLLKWKAAGVPQSIKDAWYASKLPPETLSGLEALISELPEELVVQIPQQLLSMSLAMANIVAAAAAQLLELS